MNDSMSKRAVVFWACIGLIIFSAIMFLVGKAIASDGRTTYCYIEHLNDGIYLPRSIYVVWESRPWRSDRRFAVTLSHEDAEKIMNESCPAK